MNKQRRTRIEEAVTIMETAKGILGECRDEEQEYMDNMPENMQGGDKYSAAEEAVSSLDSAITDMDTAIESANEIN
jgi:hypothetical protein